MTSLHPASTQEKKESTTSEDARAATSTAKETHETAGSSPRSFFSPPAENSRLFLLLFLAALAAFGPFVTDFYLPTLPEQALDFQTSPSTVQLGLSMTMWGLAIGQLFVGPLSDVKGRRKPLLWSLLVFAASTFGAVAAPNVQIFLAMRFLEGLGASGAIVMSRAVAADRYTGKALGSFMGVMGSIQGIAPITAPLLGSLIADAIGWRGIFWILFAAGIVLLAITFTRLAETRSPADRRRSTKSKATPDVVPQSASAIEERTPEPSETLGTSVRRLFGDPVFVAIVLQQIFSSAVLFAHIASSPFIFQTHFGLSATEYGFFFGAMALGIAAGAAFSGKLASPAFAMLAGAVGMLAASSGVAALYAAEASLLAIVPVYFALLVMLGLTLPAAMTAALSRHRPRSGLAAAILGAVGFGGGGLVAPLTSIGEATTSTAILFIASSALLCVIGVALMRRMKREAAQA